MISRIILSIKNRIFRSLLFVLLFFILSLFLCSSLLITRSYHQSRKAIVSTLNTQVVIVDKGLSLEGMADLQSAAEYKLRVDEFVEMIDDLRSQPYVKYGDVNYMLDRANFMNSCRINEQNQIECVSRTIDRKLGSEASFEYFKDLLNKKEVATTRYGGNIKSVKEAKWTLYAKFREVLVPDTNSRIFTQEEIDSGAFVAVIDSSNTLISETEEKRLEVGDTVPISIMINHEDGLISYKTEEFEIIGITDSSGNNKMQLYDPIYIPEKAWRKIAKESAEIANEECAGYYDELIYLIEVSDAYFELESFDDLEDFTKLIQNYQKERKSIEYYTNVDQMLPFVSDLKLIEFQFLFLSGFIMVSSIILTSLLMHMEQLHRSKETMILSALGEKQSRILSQYWIEYLILGIAGFVLAAIVLSGNLQYFNPSFDVAQMQTVSDYLEAVSVQAGVSMKLSDWLGMGMIQFLILSGSFLLINGISKNRKSFKTEE